MKQPLRQLDLLLHPAAPPAHAILVTAVIHELRPLIHAIGDLHSFEHMLNQFSG